MTAKIAPHRIGYPAPLAFHLSQAAGLIHHACLAAYAENPEKMRAHPLTVTQVGLDKLAQMTDGISRWQHHPWRRPEQTIPVLWSAGSTRLMDYGHGFGRPILILPSLINQAYILDITSKRSFLKRLTNAGFRPLLLDWGCPGADETCFDMGDYADQRLRPALAIARVLAGGPVPVLGYCMGGNFAAAAAANLSNDVACLTLIGTPWNHEGGIWLTSEIQKLITSNAATLRATLTTIGDIFGVIPPIVMQSLFASLDPGLALRKFSKFSNVENKSDLTELFVAVEDWLNDPMPVTIGVAKTLLIDWGLHNSTVNAKWSILGKTVSPKAITCPTLAFCALQDRICPPENAHALPKAIPNATIMQPKTGHVGMIVGKQSGTEILNPLIQFLNETSPQTG